MLATAAQAGEIFRYVTEDGVVSFTDELKRVPARYKDVAERVILDEEFKDFNRLSVATVDSTLPVLPKLTNRVTVDARTGSAIITNCTGHVSVTSERHQFGDYNRTVYLVHDECGDLISVTSYQPEVRIER
jgi:hypothetical protein